MEKFYELLIDPFSKQFDAGAPRRDNLAPRADAVPHMVFGL